MDMSGRFHAPAALHQVKYIILYPPYKTFRGHQGRSGRETDTPAVERVS
jgi:hypothetical protein